MCINNKIPYTKPETSVRSIGVENSLLVGSPGMRVFETAEVNINAQTVEVHDDEHDPFKFSWE